MFLNRNIIYSIIIVSTVLCLLFASCSEYQKILKSDDAELKFEKAIEYYEDGDYFRAKTLLADLRSYYRGTAKAEKINFYNAYAHYGSGELRLAAYYFKEFANSFPTSEYREEAEYMAALCYYHLSPQVSLEQVFTKRAIDELQLFLDRFPESERRDTVNVFMDELQQKLELKAFNNAHLYYKIGSYRAAVTALNNVLVDFPDTKFREDIMFYIVKAKYEYADNSVRDMQAERYRKAVEAYYDLVDMYPESDRIREAERLYDNAINFLKNHEGL